MSAMLASTIKTAAVAAVACMAVVDAGHAQKTTDALDCTKNNKPYQMVVEDKSFDLVVMDWTTGGRTTLWSIEKSSAPGIGSPNACGISPKDDKVYCMVKYDSKAYLARVDQDGFAFVASSPKWSYSGTFDEEGDYYMDAGTSLYKLLAPDMRVGYEKPFSALPALEKLDANLESHKRHGSDSVVSVEPDSGSSGIVSGGKYITVNKGQPVITDLEDGYKTWKPTLQSGPKLPDTGFGGGYWYSGSMYFSANDGSGVYKVVFTDTFDQFTATRVGESYKTKSNDGMNCLFAEEPVVSTTALATTASTAAPPTAPTTTAQESMPESVDDANELGAEKQGVLRLYSSGGGLAVTEESSARIVGAVVGVAMIAVVAALFSGSGRARTAQWTRMSEEDTDLDVQLVV